MNTIYRYPVTNPSGVNKVMMPINAKIISAGVAHNPDTDTEEISVWAQVESTNEKKERTIVVAGTGADLDEMNLYNPHFIATVQKADRFAFHIFEVEE